MISQEINGLQQVVEKPIENESDQRENGSLTSTQSNNTADDSDKSDNSDTVKNAVVNTNGLDGQTSDESTTPANELNNTDQKAGAAGRNNDKVRRTADGNRNLKNGIVSQNAKQKGAGRSNVATGSKDDVAQNKDGNQNSIAQNNTSNQNIPNSSNAADVKSTNNQPNGMSNAVNDAAVVDAQTVNSNDAIAGNVLGKQPFDNKVVDSLNIEESSLDDIALQDERPAADFKEDEPINRWSAATVVAPVYASSFTGSSVNDRVGRDGQIAQTNLSYGVAVNYNLDSRWSVRTGVHQVNMSYNNSDINYGLNESTINFNDGQAITVFDATAVNIPSRTRFSSIPSGDSQELQNAAVFSNFKGELSQQLGYIEVPFEVRYRMVDKKFGLSVLGGLSALFLTDNQVSIDNGGRRLELGTDDNFQDFNQSANFGLGLDYRLSKRLGLSLEPTFKYQLNALRDDSADFRPYTVGIYTGLMYRF